MKPELKPEVQVSFEEVEAKIKCYNEELQQQINARNNAILNMARFQGAIAGMEELKQYALKKEQKNTDAETPGKPEE